MALSDKQRVFVDEYLVDLNATQAAIRAGYLFAENVPADRYYTYLLIDPRSGLVFYVGKGKGRRMSCHARLARLGVVDNAEKFRKITEIHSSGEIVADHIRSSAFLITDGVSPSNKDRGYMLRKLLRRAIVHSNALLVGSFEQLDSLHPEYKKLLTKLFTMICDAYASQYSLNKELILETLASESAKFEATFRNGIKEMRRFDVLDAVSAFKLYESFGMPYEVIKEFGGPKSSTLTRDDFEKELEKHRELSRAGAEKKFGGHGLLLDTGELKAKDEVELKKVTRLHTATHLLNATYLAAGAHSLAESTFHLTELWSNMTSDQVFRTDAVTMGKIGNMAL
jgi:alanyl-tRNA synthetase